jgi:hypothetical protein
MDYFVFLESGCDSKKTNRFHGRILTQAFDAQNTILNLREQRMTPSHSSVRGYH